MLSIPKVLIGAPINSRKAYCIDSYLKHIQSFTYPNKTFYFSDNSVDYTWGARKMVVENGIDSDWISPKGKPNNYYICESQNQIRDHFLQCDAEWFLSLEVDQYPPTNIIERMLDEDAPVVSARYFIGEGSGSHLLATEFDDSYTPNINRNIFSLETFMSYGTGKNISGNCGMGCALFHKDVIRMIPFQVEDDSTHLDTYVSRQLDFYGIEVRYLDVIVEHHNRNWNFVSDHIKK